MIVIGKIARLISFYLRDLQEERRMNITKRFTAIKIDRSNLLSDELPTSFIVVNRLSC